MVGSPSEFCIGAEGCDVFQIRIGTCEISSCDQSFGVDGIEEGNHGKSGDEGTESEFLRTVCGDGGNEPCKSDGEPDHEDGCVEPEFGEPESLSVNRHSEDG